MMRTALPQAGSIQITPGRTAHIMIPDAWWVMTHCGVICQIKNSDDYQDDNHRYRRNGWTSETTARTQAAKLNAQFRTQDFGVLQVQISGEPHGTSTSKT